MFFTAWTHSQFFMHAYSKLEERYYNISYAKTSNLKADTFCESCINKCVRNARTEMVERPDPVLPTLPMSADLSDVHYTRLIIHKQYLSHIMFVKSSLYTERSSYLELL